MITLKCKMCGGTIEFEQGATVGVCDSCGTKQTLPRLDDDRKANLYDRANHFRRNNEFDKAMAIYEQILNEDSTDAESYWSLVLCRYGIEYVEDPATRKRVPTVNRAQFTSIFDDEDYKSALQYADERQRAIYEQEAATINDIQKNILTISGQEDPFDVFICYKESDNSGRRTPDSVLATELYHELTREGYKVFFSRITLEDKLGTAYEPYIFAALNSARVMVVLGTRPEYFNAVWVRNEWSRYLALIKNGARKLLIPAYKDMDPYDLPEEFSHLQAQDMSKLGFMQDLIRGIGKVIGADTPQAPAKETVVMKNENGTVRAFLDRGFMALEDGEWDKADEFFEQALNFDAKIAEAYLGKLMAELRVYRQDELASLAEPFDDYNNYQKAVRFGDTTFSATLKQMVETINARNENDRLQTLYDQAAEVYENACTEERYKTAAEMFSHIPGFRDADEKAAACTEKAEICRKDELYTAAQRGMRGEYYDMALRRLQSIPGWKDADDLAAICTAKLAEEKAKLEANRLKEERKKRRTRHAIAIGISSLAVCAALTILTMTIIVPSFRYARATKLYDAGQYAEAASAFRAIGNYKDSYDKELACYDAGTNMDFTGLKAGDSVQFGVYEQDNDLQNGPEIIQWDVLAVEDDRALLISHYVLDAKPYNATRTDVTWETCTLRTWLNGEFFQKAFGDKAQEKILSSTVPADVNSEYKSSPGNATTDKIFLLSIPEADRYFPSDEARMCSPTDYAIAQGWDGYTSSSCYWSLRTAGRSVTIGASTKAHVSLSGEISYAGSSVEGIVNGVRPAMWIDISNQ